VPRKNSNGENCIIPAPRHPLVATLLPKTIYPEKSYTAAAANCVMETPATITHCQKNTVQQVPKRCTDDSMVTLITTVKLIMRALQTADTEEDKFALLMRVV